MRCVKVQKIVHDEISAVNGKILKQVLKGELTCMPRIFFSPLARRLYQYPNGGDEYHWMNKIVDGMVPYLQKMDISLDKAPNNMDLQAAIDLANQSYYDIYLSLGTGKSPENQEGRYKGASFRYYKHSILGKHAAMYFAENFKKIYPQPELVSAVAATTPQELTDTIAPAVLMTIAYHDNPQDEIWLTTSIEDIVRNLAESIVEIFQSRSDHPDIGSLNS